MRTPITRIERATGLFLMIVMSLLAVTVLASGRLLELVDLVRADFVIVAVSPSGFGAAVGSPVKVRDVEVGSVTKVTLVQDPAHPDAPVRIQMRIQPKAAAFLRDRTVAVIVMPPLGSGMPPFGTSSVELRSDGDMPLARNAVIQAEGQESMVMTMAKLSKDVSVMRDELTKAIGEMGSTFQNLRKLTDSLTSGRGVAGRMMTDDKLADELAATLADARSATRDARRLMDSAEKMTAQAPAVIEDARGMTKQGRELMAKLSVAVDELPKVMAATERTLALAEELTQTLRTAAGHAPELARKVDTSLEETNRLVEAAQKNFFLRGTLPDRRVLRTESAVRPPVVMPAPATSAP